MGGGGQDAEGIHRGDHNSFLKDGTPGGKKSNTSYHYSDRHFLDSGYGQVV